MTHRIGKYVSACVGLTIAIPLAAADLPERKAEAGGISEKAGATRAEAVLFDSVDENFNPISMADLIDGKPMVLVVSSCT